MRQLQFDPPSSPPKPVRFRFFHVSTEKHTVITASAVFRQLHEKEKAALAGCSVTVPEEGLASGTAREQHSALR
jgi:hypothetical protein